MSQPPFIPGASVTLAPGLRRVLAPNASAMTGHGTNSYIVGTGRVAVIDPGPDLPDHMSALLAALTPGESISHIFVTHAHRDHAPLARPLAARTGAPVLAFGAADAGRSPAMTRLAAAGLAGGGEGVDAGFAPDLLMADGTRIAGDDWQLEAIHTPGHMGNHLCFAWDERLFSGDHVMGWASSLISPPDGDMGAYMASLARLGTRNWQEFHPGHGAPIADPAARLNELATHRRAREAAILDALSLGGQRIAQIVAEVYCETPDHLRPAAARNVLAHLLDLAERGLVAADPTPGPRALFWRT